MLGRLTLSLLNETVEAFSNTLKEKYSFLKKYEHASTTNDVDYKRLQVYKAQETPETKGGHRSSLLNIYIPNQTFTFRHQVLHGERHPRAEQHEERHHHPQGIAMPSTLQAD